MRIHPAERAFKIIAGLLVVVVLGVTLFTVSKLVVYSTIAIILAYVLVPVVNFLESKGLSRSVTAFSIISMLMAALFLLSRTLVPVIGNQIVKLVSEFDPETVANLSEVIEKQVSTVVGFLPAGFVSTNVARFYQNLLDGTAVGGFMSNLLELFTNIFYAILIVPVTVFFLLRDGLNIEKSLLRMVPNAYFETTLALISKIERSLGRYLKGVLLQSIIVATLSSLLLSLAGMKNALSVGLALGLANVVPYFGPLIGDFLAITVSIVETGDMTLVGPVIMAVLITKAIDNVILQPLIFSRSTEMHPVVILFVVLIAAELGGILAMLVAVPVATILKITFEQILWTFRNYTVFRSYG